MKEYPYVTSDELLKEDEEAYHVYMKLVYDVALAIYSSKEIEGMGLEECFETVVKMMDEGTLKLYYEEQGDKLMYGVQRYDPDTGEYRPVPIW
jgi:hypothetical protein